MDRRQSSLRKTAAILFVFLLGGSISLAVSALLAEGILFQPAFYRQALSGEEYYHRFPGLLADQLVFTPSLLTHGVLEPNGQSSNQGDDSSGSSVEIKYLNQSDYEKIIRGLLTDTWIRSQTNHAIDQIFDYLNLKTQILSIRVSMIDVKTRLAGDEGVQVAAIVIRSWPPCSLDQILEITALGLRGHISGLPVCQPPEDLLAVVTPIFRILLIDMAKSLPDTLDLARLIPGNRPLIPVSGGSALAVQASWVDFYPIYRDLRWALRFSPLLVLVNLIILTLFAVRNGRDLLKWWGASLVVGGVLAGLLGVGVTPAVNGIHNAMARGISAVITPGFLQVAFDTLRFVAGRFQTWLYLGAILMVVVGLIGIVISSQFRSEAA